MSESYRDALAELSAATTAYLRDPGELLRLAKARKRADALLGDRRPVTPMCDCGGAAHGFHSPTCSLVKVSHAA